MGMKILTEIFFFSAKEKRRTRGHGITLAKKQCRLDIRHFSQRTVNEWNRLSADCVGATSVNMFKNKIDIYLRRAGYSRFMVLYECSYYYYLISHVLCVVGNFLADMYAALWAVDSSIMLSTNHRSESQLIVDNAARISQRQCPVIDQAGRFCQTTIGENRDHSTEYPECGRWQHLFTLRCLA